jgi:hypothetical protein
MKVSIYALEKLLKEYESNIANASKQLKDLDAGKITLSPLKVASVENTLEFSTAEYEKYKAIYDAIPEKEKEEFRNLKEVQELLAKQSYYKLQKIRIKRNLNLKRNQRLEAMMILDELPEEVHFDDAQLIEVTNIIIKYNARESVELVAELGVIRDEFDKQLEALKDKEDLKHFNFLDTYIPIIILHFAIISEKISKRLLSLYNEKENEKLVKMKNQNLSILLAFQSIMIGGLMSYSPIMKHILDFIYGKKRLKRCVLQSNKNCFGKKSFQIG